MLMNYVSFSLISSDVFDSSRFHPWVDSVRRFHTLRENLCALVRYVSCIQHISMSNLLGTLIVVLFYLNPLCIIFRLCPAAFLCSSPVTSEESEFVVPVMLTPLRHVAQHHSHMATMSHRNDNISI